MGKHAALFGIAFFCSASIASAAPITYDVTVDSSSISGTAGSLDFQFNPGPLVTQAASVEILDFMSDGGMLVGSPVPMGDVTGTLPGTPGMPAVTFQNDMAFNDYFQGFTYGSTLSFEVSLFGPALSTPDGVSTSGSRFAFSMFSDAAGTIPVLTTDTVNGFAFTIDVNLDGTTTVTNCSPQTTIPTTTVTNCSPQTTPEPNTLALLAVGVGLCLAFAVRPQRR
jgi:hypothetical protein